MTVVYNAPKDIKSFDIDGFSLRYCRDGVGLPALVVGSAHYYPRTFSKKLHERLDITYVDHRVFTREPAIARPQSDYAVDKIIDDIEAFRQYMGLDKIIIMGHSGHAYFALEYAKKYPAHVSHVVMLGSTPSLGLDVKALGEQYWTESVCPERRAADEAFQAAIPLSSMTGLSARDTFVQHYLRATARLWYDTRVDARALWDDVDINMPMFEYMWGEVFRDIDITKNLEKLKAPVFVGLGRYDFIAPYCTWHSMRQYFHDITVRVFEKSGHTPQFEEPVLFDETLLNWLK